jgi:peptide deformylase
MIREVLLLGNPKLYEVSQMINQDELDTLKEVVDDLHDTLIDFKEKYGAGRAIAAPQIGVMKRLIYMYIDSPVVFINPALTDKSKDMMLVWDDCLCFPDLLVKVERHKSCSIAYLDMDWKEQKMWLEGDLSELLQHEYDHLDGILAVSHAVDEQSFALRSQRELLQAPSS